MRPGVGVVFIPELEPLLQARPELVDYVEIEPQTLWRHSPTREPAYRCDDRAIARLRGLPQSKLVHGVGFPVGGSRLPDPRHLELLRRFVLELDCPWWSEHLAFNLAGRAGDEFQAGFLLPPLPTPKGVETAVRSIRSVRRAIDRPFAIETGVNYLQPRAGELPDGEFVRAVAEGADCGILLDLHNLWAGERNGRQSVAEFVAALPVERVIEVHLAGGMELDGYWLDAHSGPVPEELLAIAREIVPRLPRARAVTFEMLPEFHAQVGEEAVIETLRAVRGICEHPLQVALGPSTLPKPQSLDVQPSSPLEPADWEDALALLVNGRQPEADAECEDSARDELMRELALDPGIPVLAHLVWYGRAGRIAEGLTLTCKLVARVLGKKRLRELLHEHFRLAPPQLFATEEARSFAAFLESKDLDVPYLADVIAFERATLHVWVHEEPVAVSLEHDPEELLEAIANGRVPEYLARGNYALTIDPDAEETSRARKMPVLG